MLDNKPIAIVDVDNILHPFHDHLYKLLKEVSADIPDWRLWNTWDFYRNYITKKSFYRICDSLHAAQESLPPYNESKYLLNYLYDRYYVIIASHRQETNKIYLINWLDKYKLRFDDIYCGSDKTRLFNNDVSLVIDDSPIVLQAAIDLELDWCGLLYPWNEDINKRYKNRLFKNLKELIRYRKQQF